MEADLMPTGLSNADTKHFVIQTGSKLEGKIRIFASKLLKDAHVEIVLRGFVETRTKDDVQGDQPSGKESTRACYTKKFLEQVQVVRDPSTDSAISPHIPVSQFGPLQIPFCFDIPEDVPPSFEESALGRIQYSLKAKISYRHGSFKYLDYFVRSPVTIYKPWSELGWFTETFERDRTHPFDVLVNLSDSYFTPGTSLHVNIQLESIPLACFLEYIKASIESNVKVRRLAADGKTNDVLSTSQPVKVYYPNAQDQSNITHFHSFSCSFTLDIPQHSRPSLKSKLLVIKHCLLVEIALFDRPSSVFVEIPIHIIHQPDSLIQDTVSFSYKSPEPFEWTHSRPVSLFDYFLDQLDQSISHSSMSCPPSEQDDHSPADTPLAGSPEFPAINLLEEEYFTAKGKLDGLMSDLNLYSKRQPLWANFPFIEDEECSSDLFSEPSSVYK